MKIGASSLEPEELLDRADFGRPFELQVGSHASRSSRLVAFRRKPRRIHQMSTDSVHRQTCDAAFPQVALGRLFPAWVTDAVGVYESLRGRLAGQAVEQHGIFTRAQALESGYSSREVQHLLDHSSWHRLRVGVYVEHCLWMVWSARDRYLALARAALMRVGDDSAASHVTAGMVHGYDLHEPDLSWVHLTRSRCRSARREAGIDHHVGRLGLDEIEELDGFRVTSPARTVVDIAAMSSFEAGLVTIDCALNRGLDPEILREQLASQVEWQGMRTASRAVLCADGRAQSPGETLTRVVFMEQGIPAPDLQGRFDNPDGSVFALTDFVWWKYRTVAEFDGKRKYYRDLHDGEDPGEIVWREKQREDRIREEFGFEVIRITWPDLYPSRRSALGRRTREALDRGAVLGRRRSA